VAEAGLSEKHIAFASELLAQVTEHRDWAEQQITDLAENWRLERIAAIDRIILIIALVELKERPDVPMKVAINEAIELAKEYSTGESSRFINGILDRYANQEQEPS